MEAPLMARRKARPHIGKNKRINRERRRARELKRNAKRAGRLFRKQEREARKGVDKPFE